MRKWLVVISILFSAPLTAAEWDDLARQYVELVLAVGEHDPAFVDAYYGPREWHAAVKQRAASLPAIENQLAALTTRVNAARTKGDALLPMRKQFMQKQLRAMAFRIAMLKGEKSSFDQETSVLYDAVSPHYERSYYESLLQDLELLLPGKGSLVERVNAFRSQFVIPKDKLKAVMDAAIAGCKQRTMEHIQLPEGEAFKLEFVTDRPWSGYNWYKGNYQSVIQINVELPIYIDRAVDLGCHEGYPGHHTYNALLEQKLVKEKGWMEFSVYPLFSPQSMMAEGSANYGIQMAFSDESRLAFETETLYPLAGIKTIDAAKYHAMQKLLSKLSYSDNEAARNYLDGNASKPETIDWLINVSLHPIEKAPQRIRFYDANRGYVINYNLGRDLIGNYLAGKVKGLEAPELEQTKWALFAELMSTPQLPSLLK
jgi:hypothetical protein